MKILNFILFILVVNLIFTVPRGVQHLSSYPFVSGDTFRCMADYVYDNETKNIQPAKVQDGDILFVNCDLIERFFSRIHPKINAKYILITHNSIKHLPGKYECYLNDEKLVAWFGKNILKDHPKLIRIPLGIANRYWPHGNIDVFAECIDEIEKAKETGDFEWNDKLLYMNFEVRTHKERPIVKKNFLTKDFCFNAGVKNLHSFLIETAYFKFVLSPRGSGMDCHRHWEAMLLGNIPVFKTSGLDPLFDDLPVLIINDWNQVTKEFLEEKWVEINSKKHNFEKLYADYWINQIKAVQDSLRSNLSK